MLLKYYIVVVIQPLSRVQLFVTPWAIAHQAPLSSTVSWSLLRFIELVMLSNHLILCLPLLLLPSIVYSIRVFSNELALRAGGPSIGASASASVLPMNIQGWFPLGLTGLISFAVQGTLKSLLQHHSSKGSTLQSSAFFMVQLSHSYMTTGILHSVCISCSVVSDSVTLLTLAHQVPLSVEFSRQECWRG